MRAAVCGSEKIVKLLVEHEGGMKDEYGNTALIAASHNGWPECIKLLLKKEACLRGYNGWTALMWAVYNNKLNSVQILMAKEMNIKSTHEYREFLSGTTALDIAKRKGYTDIVSILSK